MIDWQNTYKINPFWVTTPCTVVDMYRTFGRMFCLHLHGGTFLSTKLDGITSQDTVNAIQTNLSSEFGSGCTPPCVNLGKRTIRVAGFVAASVQKEKEILFSWNRILLDVNLLPGISILCCSHIYTRRVLADIYNRQMGLHLC